MCRIDRQRGQHRGNTSAMKCCSQPSAVVLGGLPPDPSPRPPASRGKNSRRSTRQQSLLVAHQGASTRSLIAASCWAGVRPSGLGGLDAGGDLRLQPGDADHVELVEVGKPRSTGSGTRSSSGWLGFCASSRTRWLKASQLSSRLKNRSAALAAIGPLSARGRRRAWRPGRFGAASAGRFARVVPAGRGRHLSGARRRGGPGAGCGLPGRRRCWATRGRRPLRSWANVLRGSGAGSGVPGYSALGAWPP